MNDSRENKPPGAPGALENGTGNPDTDPGDGDFVLDLPPAELRKARADILPPGRGKTDAARTLSSAPLPPGASMNSAPATNETSETSGTPETDRTRAAEGPPGPEDGETEAENLPDPVIAQTPPLSGPGDRILPPDFMFRLGSGTPGDKGPEVKKEGRLAWSVAAKDVWPVFLKRETLGRPADARKLAEIARVAATRGRNRLCLTPAGDLDIFFDDAGSLEDASAALKTAETGETERNDRRGPGTVLFVASAPSVHSPPSPAPPSFVAACRGLLFCPLAAVNTLAIKKALDAAMAKRDRKAKNTPATISARGCSAGGGFDCGVSEYADIVLTGGRDNPPDADRELLSLSPDIDDLVSFCPGKSLSKSGVPGKILDLDEKTCLRCGRCVSANPAFRWSGPQGSHFSVAVSGRRLAGDGEYLLPKVLLPKVAKGDEERVFDGVARLLKLFREERLKDEIFRDFLERNNLTDFLD
ncbi:MAG: hypothetical protein LBF41_03175 [Deltaproteobacteria bacterium]|jgi:dissimilatory sulfite reductase (desulfoviridin) alpha/beta subunit|nr:hypothetical protein [Deltaproteobacteria bacterium]